MTTRAVLRAKAAGVQRRRAAQDAAAKEYAAIVSDVAIAFPAGRRSVAWWLDVRTAVCAHHGAATLGDVSGPRAMVKPPRGPLNRG